MIIRDAQPADYPAIVAIYNDAIAKTVATFDLEPFTVEAREGWFAQFGGGAGGHPLIVCEEEGAVLGYACYFTFRAKEGFARTKETSIYLAAEARGRGVGSALYAELIRRAEAAGVHALVGILGGENHASVALHRKFGFREVGHYPEVGFKFGGWVDTYTYLKILEDRDS